MNPAQATPVSIVVMGPRAAGKTTVGRMLAQRLGWPFVDLDDRTLRLLPGCASVADAWRRVGEAGFREAEMQALQVALGESPQVLALGGGTQTIPGAEELLASARRSPRRWLIVYLDCDANVLRERLRQAPGDRPPLRGRNAVDEVDEVLRERRPTYMRLADVVVNAAEPRESIVERILARVASGGA